MGTEDILNSMTEEQYDEGHQKAIEIDSLEEPVRWLKETKMFMGHTCSFYLVCTVNDYVKEVDAENWPKVVALLNKVWWKAPGQQGLWWSRMCDICSDFVYAL